MILDKFGKPMQSVEKVLLPQNSGFSNTSGRSLEGKRGLTVYSTAQLQQITGRDKEGSLLSWGLEQPYFYLTISQRVEMFRLCAPVLGIVSSRMKRLSGLKINITTMQRNEEKIVEELKDAKEIYEEYANTTELAYCFLKASLYKKVIRYLPEVKPDFSNFNSALLRWKRRLKRVSSDIIAEARNWLKEPNNGVPWENFVQKWSFDNMIHGAAAIYKKLENGRLENFDTLPGGTVFRLKTEYFSGLNGYVQIFPGYGIGGYAYMEPQIYFSDEIAYTDYLPTSARSHSMIPLEALINKIAENLLFDKLMANQADGTKPPEKMVIITKDNPWGSLDNVDSNMDIPLNTSEQRRLEEKINSPIPNSIMTFSGNKATVLDISRENTMGIQMERQRDITGDVALVFNVSPIEANLTGSDDTSGRSTSEVQREIDQGKGIGPLASSLATLLERNLLPMRYGYEVGLIVEYEKALNPKEEKELDLLSLQTGENSMNDIRAKYGKDSYGPEYDKPDGGQINSEPGANSSTPLYTRGI